jgi:hypothetical protein
MAISSQLYNRLGVALGDINAGAEITGILNDALSDQT